MATQMMYTADVEVGGHHLSMSFALMGDGSQGYVSLNVDGVSVLVHDLIHIPVRRVASLCQADLLRLERERHNLPDVNNAEMLLLDMLNTNIHIVRDASTLKKSRIEMTNSFIRQLEA